MSDLATNYLNILVRESLEPGSAGVGEQLQEHVGDWAARFVRHELLDEEQMSARCYALFDETGDSSESCIGRVFSTAFRFDLHDLGDFDPNQLWPAQLVRIGVYDGPYTVIKRPRQGDYVLVQSMLRGLVEHLDGLDLVCCERPRLLVRRDGWLVSLMAWSSVIGKAPLFFHRKHYESSSLL